MLTPAAKQEKQIWVQIRGRTGHGQPRKYRGLLLFYINSSDATNLDLRLKLNIFGGKHVLKCFNSVQPSH